MPLPALSFGSLQLSTPLLLSPLAGYTNLPFRRVIRELGSVGLCTTDLVNARSLLEKNRKALKLVESCAEDTPLAVQLFGAVPEEMAGAAQMLESLGVASVDVNMGCPVRKVCQVGGGSAMMTELGRTSALVRRMVDAVRIPVTCKMRLGWDDDNLTAPDLARALEDAGAAAIMVHGRTRQQGFDGSVNLAGIRRVVAAVRRIPVIGNGDITSPQAAKIMLDSTGCAGVSIGRGAFYNPWIFSHTMRYLEAGEPPPEPDFSERVRVMTRHLDLMIDVFGESLGCTMFRKVGPWYARRFGPASLFNKGIVRMSTRADYQALLAQYIAWRAQFLDENGRLLGKYSPAPHALNFRDDEADAPAVTRREAIPVPAGPNELW
ncbi:MAG TPA: tRNA dihydrouridine synthase DusB [Candidatus Methylacidiphilales bacterium]|jgi:nifR3 family TIM-barrel protein|nr:tRNA dihydrouridine synthase DusB [Candidatus Methylacidiphilales bacterium]